MRSTLRLADRTLEWSAQPGASPDRRPLATEDEKHFRDWAERYQRVLKRLSPKEELSSLGREMYEWLDGGASWLGRARQAGGAPPWIVDFVVSVDPGPLEVAFLETPWELLNDGTAPLAGNREIVFCPVRRFGRPGDEERPSADRLSGVFMTALPEGATDLAFEDEETGILNATSGVGMDLIVEDSGNLDRLGDLLGILGRVDVLHLSCHGALKPEPVLLLENEVGGPVRATADDLDSALQPHRPRLLFLSACQTAGADQLLGSLAATLVRRGVPALLGWGGSVRDDQASQFAAELYQRLSRKARLDEATAWARLELLSQRPSGDWHLARLFAGAAGGGTLSTGIRKRSVKDRRKVAEKAFLDARRQAVPVAGPEEFVGRRRDLQRILRAYRDEGALGVLIHAIGRQGKSSLALRVVQRLPDYRPVVLFGPFDGGTLLDAIAEAVAEPEARTLVGQNREAVQKSEDVLVDVLVRLLETYCAQSDERHKPLLFVLDDFEQLLEEDAPPPRRLQARFVEPVRALLRALKRAETESKLLITSRYTFTLPWQGRDLAQDLVAHPLPRMSDSDRRKQLRVKLRLREATVDPEIQSRLLEAAQGNPGLQDLLTVLLLEAPERAERAISEMEAHLAGQGEPEQEEVVAFLSNLALENLIELLSPAERELLRISTLFSLPIPETVMKRLSSDAGPNDQIDKAFDRLIGLGLWEVHSPKTGESVLISGLTSPHAGILSEEEQRRYAERVVESLFAAWGGTAGRLSRPYAQDLELTRLSLLAGDAEIVAVCAQDAIMALERRFLNREAADLGREAIAFLDEKGMAVPIGLLRKTAEVCWPIGDTATARELYGRAKEGIADAQTHGRQLDANGHAAVLVSHSRLLVQDGRINEALEGFEQARELFSQGGQSREVAVTLGEIARIKVDRGEVDEALKLHEEELRVYEALGDARARAVTLGDIARIKVDRGEVDEALKLHEERLRVFEALGDARERALTLGDIARIKFGRGEVDEALQLYEEKLRVVEALGHARSRAVTLGDIARIKFYRGEIEEALQLHEEELKIRQTLGDMGGKANTLWWLSQIDLNRSEPVKAVERLTEAYGIIKGIGHLLGISQVGWDLGRLLCAAGTVEEGRIILERSLAGFRHLRQDSMAQAVEAFLATLPPPPEDPGSPATE